MGMTETASRLIARFGQQADIERETNPPQTPWDPPGGVELHPCTIAVARYELDLQDGTLVQRDDRRVFVSTEGLTIELRVADKLIIDGLSYAILSVEPLAPDGEPRFYEVQARI